ncbi:MAG: hypothetical protein ACRDLB_01960 [Actinomycetota bacterium]
MMGILERSERERVLRDEMVKAALEGLGQAALLLGCANMEAEADEVRGLIRRLRR